jgi:hypothetical protein
VLEQMKRDMDLVPNSGKTDRRTTGRGYKNPINSNVWRGDTGGPRMGRQVGVVPPWSCGAFQRRGRTRRSGLRHYQAALPTPAPWGLIHIYRGGLISQACGCSRRGDAHAPRKRLPADPARDKNTDAERDLARRRVARSSILRDLRAAASTHVSLTSSTGSCGAGSVVVARAGTGEDQGRWSPRRFERPSE